MNPKKWLKIITLPQGTLYRSISEIQEVLDESLDFLSQISSLWTQWTFHKFLDQVLKSQSMPRSYALCHMIKFTDKKRKEQVWSQPHWLPSLWQSSVHLSGLTCSVSPPIKLLGMGRETDSGRWYFFHSIYFWWGSGGQDDLSSSRKHIVQKAVRGREKHQKG